MTNELIKLLSDIKELIIAWNNNQFLNEEEFLTELRPLSAKLIEELKKQEPLKIKE